MSPRFSFFYNVIHKVREFRKPVELKKFIAHNKRIFKNYKQRVKQQTSLVLFEFNGMHSSYIAASYLGNALAAEHGAQIKAYVPLSGDWLKRIAYKIRKGSGVDGYGVYRSFGTSGFIEIHPSREQKARAHLIFYKVFGELKTKKDIEDVVINGVCVGDLIYDTFLMTYKKPTIEKEWQEFQSFLLQSIELFVVWEDLFKTHDIRAITVSHCVYNLAIPLRIAVQKNIPVYQSSVTHIYRLSKENLYAYNDFFYFRERFSSLPSDVQKAGIAEAKKRIERRFSGEVGVDMRYSTKSAFGAPRHNRLLKDSPRKKILIATHCFFDSPHSYGNNIFPDFYEWLDFLGKMTECTDYDWYIKTHPDYLAGTMEIIESFIARYPKLTLLPADASHHQIISEGINLALTTYGTIAFEYAALGVPVINASQNNPHIAYDFNLHAKDIEDYRRLLLDLDSLDFTIDQQQIYEFYFMQHIFNTSNLFFNNYEKAIEELGGYYEQFTPAVYEKWLEEWTPNKHRAINSALETFIKSGDFRMDFRHFDQDITLKSIGLNL